MDKYNEIPVHSNKVPIDPGWNDPPKSSYNAQQTITNRPRNFLNKRIAFPLSGTGSTPAPAPINIPPMSKATTFAASAQTNNKNGVDIDSDKVLIDSESTLKEVKNTLLRFVDNGDLGSKANDVKKRISVMEDMWLNGKLNINIQIRMKELAYALENEQPHKADEIHKSLMVDHVSAVSTWMSGVKQIIYHCIARSDLLTIDKQETDKSDEN